MRTTTVQPLGANAKNANGSGRTSADLLESLRADNERLAQLLESVSPDVEALLAQVNADFGNLQDLLDAAAVDAAVILSELQGGSAAQNDGTRGEGNLRNLQSP